MRIFGAALVTETNTFAPLPCGRSAWEDYVIARGTGSDPDSGTLFGPLLALWKGMAEQAGAEFHESLCAFCAPGGRTLDVVYEEFKAMIIEDLKAAMPLDIALLCLHGAMASDSVDDCEGDLLAAVREIVGPDCIIGVELDLHLHLTEEILDHSDLLVAYKEYPHTDTGARAAELFQLAVRAAMGEIKPVTRAYDCNMMGQWRTGQEDVRAFVDDMMAAEQDGTALNISFVHGFPWADVPTVGAKLWVTTDGDAEAAERLAEEWGRRAALGLREAGCIPQLTVDELVDYLPKAPEGLIVGADMADNAGGGAPSDSSFVLEGLVRRGVKDAAVGVVWDMTAVDICRNAGVGAELDLRVGGKCSTASGDPVDGRAIIRSIIEDHCPPGLGGIPGPFGTSVWIEFEGVDVIISSLRNQTFHPAAFTDHGIDLSTKRLCVVKSIEHFHAEFKPIADEVVYINTPGALRADFMSMPYTKRKLDYWPKVEEPPIGPFPAN
ncbi:MAG: M81 family metallopeptidase [Erythrobacter sp.]|uniref:M81 family metallopeptidase n=1 Tax=Erythrobacter sp. TaxID=1042 RepID=UPI0026140C87|nr:M81 family metallopeptidase [Erythrobacter sp.]MDJ0978179.1 M81 family metallopeptidase [Erythrobacter sp.]